jgi:ABC-type uncharacterized transport system permease subunit
MTSDLFGMSFIAYFVASVLYLTNLHVKKKHMAAYGSLATSAGFTLQTARLIMQIQQTGSPFSNANEAMFFLSWAIALLYLVVLIWFKLPAVGALAMPLSMIALMLAYRFSSIGTGKPIAGDQWLNAHVVSIVLSMAAFTLAFCCAIFYLVQNKLLKSKKLKGMFRKLPPLEVVDKIAYDLAALGLALLTLGIVTGIVGVETSTLAQKMSPLKIVVAALTWVIYVAYMIARSAAGWRGKKANWILIAGVVMIIAATGLHKFAWL